jgi:hypothetical protein
VPTSEAIGRILMPFYEQAAKEERFFCGADLEEAVNLAYYRRLRQTVSSLSPGADYEAVSVNITGEDLWKALGEVPRSVTKAAVAHFLNDVKRFCGDSLAQQISAAVFQAGNAATANR